MNDLKSGVRPVLENPGFCILSVQSASRWERNVQDQLDFSEFFLRQSSLLENRSKCSSGHVGRVHGDVPFVARQDAATPHASRTASE